MSRRWADPCLLLVTIVRGRDFALGLVAATATAGLATSAGVRDAGVTVLIAAAALDVAVLTIVLAAMTILTGYVEGPYRKVLEAIGGVSRAFVPFRAVTTIAAVAAILAMIAAAGWPALGVWPRATALAVATGLMACVLGGAAGLVGIVLFHAEQRAQLARAMDDASELKHRRLRDGEA